MTCHWRVRHTFCPQDDMIQDQKIPVSIFPQHWQGHEKHHVYSSTYSRICKNPSEYMAGNSTYIAEFILKGITDRPELQAPCFVVFMVIYLVTVLGNLGFITLIRSDTRLHTPMYYFLSHLAFVDLCYSSAITPKMMVNFVVEHNTTAVFECSRSIIIIVLNKI